MTLRDRPQHSVLCPLLIEGFYFIMQAAAPTPDFMVFTGNANPALATEIAGHLGIAIGAANVSRFSDG